MNGSFIQMKLYVCVCERNGEEEVACRWTYIYTVFFIFKKRIRTQIQKIHLEVGRFGFRAGDCSDAVARPRTLSMIAIMKMR